MPELPEVETIKRSLEERVLGKVITSVFQGKKKLRRALPDLRLLEKSTIVAISRRAKYLIFKIEPSRVVSQNITRHECDQTQNLERERQDTEDLALLVHLGMSGRLVFGKGEVFRETLRQKDPLSLQAYFPVRDMKPEHVHAIFFLSGGEMLFYYDPRRFGFLDLTAYENVSRHPSLVVLGCEPDDPGLRGVTLLEKFQRQNRSLKSFLLDQSFISGLGNIYVAEALFRAGLSPLQNTRELLKSPKASMLLERLLLEIKVVLSEAVTFGGSTLKDYVSASSHVGAFQNRFCVYDRLGQPCLRPHCGGVISRIIQQGRATFYCPSCQREEPISDEL